MRRTLVPILLLLVGGLGVWLLPGLLQEGPTTLPPEPEWDARWTEPAQVAASTGSRLLRVVVPFSPPDLESGCIPATALREEKEDGTRIYETSIGPITLSAYFADRGDPDAVKQLGQAMQVATDWRKTAPGDAEPWTFQSLGPVGGYLQHPRMDVVVTDVTVLQARGVAPRDPEAEIRGIRTAVASVMEEVRASDAVDAWVGAALDELLARLDDPPADEAGPGVEPDFARQIVSDPEWLRAVVPSVSATRRDAVVEAVRKARTLRPCAQFANAPMLLTQLSDAWRPRGWHLRLSHLSVYARTPPMSFHAVDRRRTLQSCQILYSLSDHADPIAVPEVLLRTDAFLLREGTLLASWTVERGLGCDYRAWRRAFPRYLLPAVDGHWPPHVPIVGPDGTLYGLGTRQGLLRPPRRGEKDEAERFVATAARILPDAAHLDLLQQYFVRYCLDTPSTSIPLMIGCPEHSADIHQTVDQLLATSTSGVCRGDCDDFAELVHDIARRQGRLAYVLSLPGHLATAWAEPRDGEWRAYLLQTGPTLEFRGPDLGSALKQVLLRLAPNEPFDRDHVALSLRFSGESTRSRFGVSIRVFEDAEYAKTMIDVQGDWHASRYLCVLRTLRELASQDSSAGTLSELASICGRLGLHAEAADLTKRLVALTSDPENRVLKQIDWIGHVLGSGGRAEAEAATAQLLETDLPALAPQLGSRILAVCLGLVEALDADPALAARVLARMVELDMGVPKESLAKLLASDAPPEGWRKHEDHRTLQRLAVDLAWAFVSVTGSARSASQPSASKHLDAVAGPVDVWLGQHALDGTSDAGMRDSRWALRAERLMASEPAFLDRILSATPLAAPDPAEPPKPTEGVIASHARTSVRFLAGALTDSVYASQKPDAARARRILGVMADAARVQRRLGLQDADGLNLLQRGCLAAALITEDEKGLRDALAEIGHLRSRIDTGRAAAVIGRFARHAGPAWWKVVIRCWKDLMPGDAHDFQIVWRAHAVGAVPHALAMSVLAATRSPGNEALQEEARLFAAFVANGAAPDALRPRPGDANDGR